MDRFARKLVVQLTIASGIPLALRLCINLSWETLSKAFWTSKASIEGIRPYALINLSFSVKI